MLVTQISVLFEDQSERLAEATGALSEAGIDMQALVFVDTPKGAILRMIVSDHEKAKAVLKEKNFNIAEANVIALEAPNKPGGLHTVLNLFRKYHIRVEYMYAFVAQNGQNAIMIFRFKNMDETLKMLEDNGLTVTTSMKVYTL